MKRILLLFVIFSLTLFCGSEIVIASKGRIKTVVIDPGHGGRDPGAVGKNSMEKDIALALGLKLGQYIEENLPDVNIIYTRRTDEFIELNRRSQIANENNADLFISIHCNSMPNNTTYGTETFVMGLHRSEANLEVAKRENAAILYEDDYMETYDGFDPYSPEANIVFTLYQYAYLENSLEMASQVQQQFRERANRVDRGVKQAGFLVLYEITMPGILVEAGFLSNPEEERFLMSERGQTYIASAVFRAFRDYKEEQERLYLARKGSYTETTVKTEDLVDILTDPVIEEIAEAQTEPVTEEVVETVDTQEPLIIPDSSFDYQYADNGSISFRVQIATTVEKKPLDSPEFAILRNVGYYFHEGLYKYTVGNESTLEDAARIQQEVQSAGFKDAFVVAFVGNERISPTEAIKLLRELKSDNK